MPFPLDQPPDGPTTPAGTPGTGAGGAGATKPLQVFGRDGLVSPDAPGAAGAAAGAANQAGPLVPLLIAAGVALLLHGLLLLAASPSLPTAGSARLLLVLQWLAGGLLVLPVGLCLHRVSGRTAPAVLAAAVLTLHPGVLSATLHPGGGFWALASVATALFLLFGGDPTPASARRPVPGVAPCAAAGLVLGAGGVLALPVVALAAPLALWRMLWGLGCPGPGRGPRDAVAAVVLLAAAAISVAGFHTLDGDTLLVRRVTQPHGEVVPRLIESRWPTLLGQMGLAPGLDLAGEFSAALDGPPADGQTPRSPAPTVPAEPSLFDAAMAQAWTGLNAALLTFSLAAAGLALHRRRRALGLMLLLAVPAALVAAGPSGEALRLALLPLQLLLLGVFWLPPRRFRRVSAVFHEPTADAGFVIKQNTPRVI